MSEDWFDMIGGRRGKQAELEELTLRLDARNHQTLEQDAKRYFVSDELASAINVCLATGRPLLLTGDPGTGKTLAAYYIAERFSLGRVLHFQAKSDTKHTDILYEFDAVAYLRQAYAGGVPRGAEAEDDGSLTKRDFVEKRELWHAFASPSPRVLLVDEIDKAPRDFPNDLLMEFDRARFAVRETGETIEAQSRPIVVITSNSERYLPAAFLRRCVFHHLELSRASLLNALKPHRSDFEQISDGLLNYAIERIFDLRKLGLQRQPTTAEAMIWLRVLSLAEKDEDRIHAAMSRLKYIGTLVKTVDDLEVARRELGLIKDDEFEGMSK